jgi:hypothetical protein
MPVKTPPILTQVRESYYLKQAAKFCYQSYANATQRADMLIWMRAWAAILGCDLSGQNPINGS